MEASPSPQSIVKVAFLFNVLSIVIDLLPLAPIFFTRSWRDLDKYYSMWSFCNSAVMNLILTAHILFILDTKNHEDALFTSIVGFFLSALFVFLLMLHKLVFETIRYARHMMAGMLIFVVLSYSVVLFAIDEQVHTSGHSFLGYALYVIAVTTVVTLNSKTLVFYEELEDGVTYYNLLIYCLSTVDGLYFVLYAHYLGTSRSLLSVVSWINAISCAIILVRLILMRFPLILRLAKAICNCLSAVVSTIIGIYWVVSFIFVLMVRLARD